MRNFRLNWWFLFIEVFFFYITNAKVVSEPRAQRYKIEEDLIMKIWGWVNCEGSFTGGDVRFCIIELWQKFTTLPCNLFDEISVVVLLLRQRDWCRYWKICFAQRKTFWMKIDRGSMEVFIMLVCGGGLLLTCAQSVDNRLIILRLDGIILR